MLKILTACTLLTLAGCSDNATRAAPKDQKAERMAKAGLTLQVNPSPRTYTVQGNQMLVLDVPSADATGFVEYQTCYIWRDAEFKTSSIHCPSALTSRFSATE